METKSFKDVYPMEPPHTFEFEVYIVPDDIKATARAVFENMRYEVYLRDGPGDEDWAVADDELLRRVERAITEERVRCAGIAREAEKELGPHNERNPEQDIQSDMADRIARRIDGLE